jgi:signal transduction histidine kinase
MVFVAFFVIYNMVKFSVYQHVDTDIDAEVQKHMTEISVHYGEIKIVHEQEWMEREHNTLDVNPVFVQFTDQNGKIFEKSPNLKNHTLSLDKNKEDRELFDSQLDHHKIRQIQIPIFENDEKVGYLLVAMSLEDAMFVMNNLLFVLEITYPTILLLLFLIARYIAGRSIRPIQNVIATSDSISRDNLNARIQLPQNRDEIYILTETINNLLDRIENAVEREKQFTSDASHELRTPLAVIKGTLEVLARKPRTVEEYNQKIGYCIQEVDRINKMVDQLLLLARLENQKQSLNLQNLSLNNAVSECLSRFDDRILTRKIQIKEHYSQNNEVVSDFYFLSIILNNIISNALKYTQEGGTIDFYIQSNEKDIEIVIQDNGMGIADDELQKIFNSFYRTKSTQDLIEIKGNGLGLSIVKRLSDVLGIQINVDSKEGHGTRFSLVFPVEN